MHTNRRFRPLVSGVALGAALAALLVGWARPASARTRVPGSPAPSAQRASAITQRAATDEAPRRQSLALDQTNIVREWNEAALEAIVETRMGPPMVTRALAMVHTCMYDAWAAYDPVAVGTALGRMLRRPAEERTDEHKREAMSVAAYRALVDLFPTERPRFDALMEAHGFDPTDETIDPATPAGVGNTACGAVLAARQTDGANQRGEMNGGLPYSDYTDYQPANTSTALTDPMRWQPLPTDAGEQRFLVPHWGLVAPFALPLPERIRPVQPPPLSDRRYQERADDLIALSAGLTDRQKMIAEYWEDGPGTVTPPGHWNRLAAFVSDRDEHTLDDDVKLFFALNNAMFDAGIAVWDCKRDYDYIRPVSAIRHLYAGRAIAAWGGPYQGTRVIDGATWTPYIATPPFAEYVSGHSTFSASAAEVLKRFTHSDALEAEVALSRGSSFVEPGLTPRNEIVLRWETLSEAADEAGISRRYGGIHFDEGDLYGRALGRTVGRHAWELAWGYITGNLPAVHLTMHADRPAVTVGEVVQYRIDVRHHSAETIPDVTVLAPLPANVTFASMEASQGLYVPETGFWHVGDLPPAADTSHAQATLTIDVIVHAGGATRSVARVMAPGEVDPEEAKRMASAWASVTIAGDGRDIEPPATGLDPARDTSGDGMPDVWTSQMGLDPSRAQAQEDPDGDGLTNLEELQLGTHPRGFHRTYFAEGALGSFFDTTLSLMNPQDEAMARVLVSLLPQDGEPVNQYARLDPQSRTSVDPGALLDPAGALFSTVVESDVPIATDRMMTWDARQYGSTSESGVSEPSATWYFAEGATAPFELFYLLQNVSPTETVRATITYLLPAEAPVTKTYTLAPRSRTTIYVNQYPELEHRLVSASIRADGPIVAERAMYLHSAGLVFSAGHASSGAPAPAETWIFAEGATTFFDTFLLMGVPGTEPGAATVRYQLPDGETVTKTYPLAPESRATIWVNGEDARLANTAVAMHVTADVPIVAERAMWWPGSAAGGGWYEATAVLGATETGTTWVVPGGADGGAGREQTYVLLANQAGDAGRARVTVVFDDHTRVVRSVELAPFARATLDIGATFPEARERTFSVMVESIGATPVPLVVECARYNSASGLPLGAGSAELASRIE